MITQKPDDQLIRNFRIVAIVIGICLAYSIYSWTVAVYKLLLNTSKDIPFVVWLSVAVMIVGIVGYVQFVASRFVRSKLLRLFLFYSCFTNLAAMIAYCFMYFSSRYSFMQELSWIIRVSASVGGLIIADFLSLALLQKARIPKFSVEQSGEEKAYTFHPLSNGHRLIHHILDLAIVIFVVGSYAPMLQEFLPTNGSLVIAGLCATFVYYFLMEAIFKVTFGKIVTDSVVVNEKGEKATTARVLVRTICRFIPFDVFSFVGEEGWHDSLSGTSVINDQYAWEDEDDTFDTYFTGEPESETASTINL
ncbi:RDD family protein [Pinibacter aurantiacus]|nr:RDD family protein [Pinibacter aurantiacus]